MDAVGDERAVLGGQRDDVGDGAERREVGELAPRVGEAEKPADRLDELECDAGAGQVARRAVVGVELGVGDRHAERQQVPGLVVVGDHDVDPVLGEHRDLGPG